MNLNTYEPQSNTEVHQGFTSDIPNIKEMALLSSLALFLIHEDTKCLTEQQYRLIYSCKELTDGVTEDEIMKMLFKHINAYLMTKEVQRMYFCADSTKAAKTLH